MRNRFGQSCVSLGCSATYWNKRHGAEVATVESSGGVCVYVTDYFDCVFGVIQVFNCCELACMVYGAKGISEVDVG
jgi:hypothetical protein